MLLFFSSLYLSIFQEMLLKNTGKYSNTVLIISVVQNSLPFFPKNTWTSTYSQFVQTLQWYKNKEKENVMSICCPETPRTVNNTVHAFMHPFYPLCVVWVPSCPQHSCYIPKWRAETSPCIILSSRLLKSQPRESVFRLWWQQSSLVAELKDGDTDDAWHLLVFLSACYAAVWP